MMKKNKIKVAAIIGVVAVALAILVTLVITSTKNNSHTEKVNSVKDLMETDTVSVIKTDDAIQDMNFKVNTSLTDKEQKMLKEALASMPSKYDIKNSFSIDLEMKDSSGAAINPEELQTVIIKGTEDNKIAPLFNTDFTDLFVYYFDGENLVPATDELSYIYPDESSIKMMFTTNKSGKYIFAILSEVEKNEKE